MHYTYEIIRSVVKAFEEKNADLIVPHFAEDAEWHMMGKQTIYGKDAIHAFLLSEDYTSHPMMAVTQTHFIVYGDEGVVAGDLTTTTNEGDPKTMHYCDIYEVEEGLVRKIFSYIVGAKN